MSEKFEFNTEFYIDDVRQIPDQINVAKNAHGVMEEHMGDDKVKGQDLYNLIVNDTSLIVLASGDVVLRMYSEDLKDNRHVATLTIANSRVDGIKLRGSNIIINAELKNVSMWDSQVENTGNGDRIVYDHFMDNVILKGCKLKNVCIGKADERANIDVMHTFIDCEMERVFLSSSKPAYVRSGVLKDSTVLSFNGGVHLRRVSLDDVNLQFEDDIQIQKGFWMNFQACRGYSMGVRSQFELTQIETPDGPLYFYRAGDGIYCVTSHKAYRVAYVDPDKGARYVEEVRRLIYDTGNEIVENDYNNSIVQYVLDTVASRLNIIKHLEQTGELRVIEHDKENTEEG